MKKDLISVIVPIYNVEEYLEECINSIINQTYKNLEIILVDDGSPDNCGIICDNYAKKDSRIKVIHQKNQGLSEARNNGFKVSKGKYISFIDSDDFVAIDFIESLYNNLKKYNADISACGFCQYYENGNVKNKNFKNIKKLYSQFDALIFLNVFGYFNVAAWNKLYKREIFDKFSFPKNQTSEDWRIMYKIIDNIDYLYYDSSIKYFYRIRTGSITKTDKIRYDGIEAAKDVIDYFKLKKYNQLLKYAYSSLMYEYVGVYNKCLQVNNIKMSDTIYKDSKAFSKKITYQYMKPIKKIQLFMYLHFRKIYNLLLKALS